MKQEDNKDEVQPNHEDKVISEIAEHSLSEQLTRPLQSIDSDCSSGCYLEDDDKLLQKSKSPTTSIDVVPQDDLEIKEGFNALQPSQREHLLPLSDDPSRNSSECRRCSVLEEEIMILKAQHRTDLLERDIQDEDILRSMVLMKEYIDHLEASDVVAPKSERKVSRVKSDLEQRLQNFDEEIERVTNDCPPRPELEVDREIADESREESATNVTNDDERHETDESSRQELLVQQLEEKNKELLAALAEASKEAKHEQTMFKERLADVQLENSLLLEELKRTKHQLLVKAEEDKKLQETNSNQLPKDATDGDFRNRIQELEEERELLYTKIDSQEAAVALMNVDEREMKEEVQALKDTLHEVLNKSEATGGSEAMAPEPEEEKLIKRLREQLADSQKLRRSQGDTISKLVQQVAELNKMTKSAEVLSTINGCTKEEIAEKIRALEAERNRWRAKSIVQERAIAKIQFTPGPFLMPAIEEGAECYPSTEISKIQHFGSSSNDDDSSDESIYEETDDDLEVLSRKRSSGVFL